MRVKNICLGALVVSLLGLGAVHGQTPEPGYRGGSSFAPGGAAPLGYGVGVNGEVGAAPVYGVGPPGGVPVGQETQTSMLSNWIVGGSPNCCGPIGGNPAIVSELFMRSGVSLPYGNGPVADALKTGWAISAGGRVLCFDQPGKNAFTIELSGLNTHSVSTNSQTIPYPLINPQTGAQVLVPGTVRSLNRTYVNVGLGMEHYLMGNGFQNTGENRWRVGFDAGGRYGTEKLLFNEFNLVHANDVTSGFYVAIHSDLEIPCGYWSFVAGVRGEWDYTFSNVAGPLVDSDVQDINLLLTLGIRF